MVWLNSRVGVLGFLTASIFYVFYKLKNRHRIYGFMALSLFIVVLLMIPFSRSRFLDASWMLTQPTTRFDPANFGTRNFYYRRDIYSCCLDLVKGPELVYGYGTGDFNDALQECYSRKNYLQLKEEGLDSNCEYFAAIHRQGVIGFVFFLALLITPFYYYLKFNYQLGSVFILLFGITALFENVLTSQKGVTFFALFCPVLYLLAKRRWEETRSPQV
jgi:O-antigen ligase